uniref:B box-type domain-containing protein n=1 Tax=Solanum lycopersicum TaxID=4081 RepID=A0A3Q7F4K8_SOLLC
MKKCELCSSIARVYCESDQASLCWDCDARVHTANFLVAKHSRILLCNSCQSLTPWTGSGSKLGPTVSVCQKYQPNPPSLTSSSSSSEDSTNRFNRRSIIGFSPNRTEENIQSHYCGITRPKEKIERSSWRWR